MRNNNSSNEIIFVSAVRKQNVLLIFTHFLIYICKMLQPPPQKKTLLVCAVMWHCHGVGCFRVSHECTTICLTSVWMCPMLTSCWRFSSTFVIRRVSCRRLLSKTCRRGRFLCLVFCVVLLTRYPVPRVHEGRSGQCFQGKPAATGLLHQGFEQFEGGGGGGSYFEGPFPALGKEWENGLNLGWKKNGFFQNHDFFPFMKGK